MALTNHILPDSPTNNFATMNPLSGSSYPLSNGNLKVSDNSTAGNKQSCFGISSGKFYFELLIQDDTTLISVGVTTNETEPTAYVENYVYVSDGRKFVGLTPSSYGSSYGVNDIIGFSVDMGAGTLVMYKNNVTQGTLVSGLSETVFPLFRTDQTGEGTFNFGQDPTFAGSKSPTTTYTDANGIGAFYYQPPTGALALCTANLPDFTPTVAGDVPQDYFKAVKYTGQTVGDAMTAWNGTTGTVSVGFQPDLVWIKPRSLAYQHQWYDSVRGALKRIGSSSTTAENTETETLKSFTSNGFTLGTDAGTNPSGGTIVAWCMKAGGAPTADNTATSGAMTANSVSLNGTLQSNYTPAGSPTIYPTRMSINTDAGFSIVSWTGDGGNNATVAHGLSVAPEMIIVKNRTAPNSWAVWHGGEPTKAAYLDTTDEFAVNSFSAYGFNEPNTSSTFPTSSVFYISATGRTFNSGITNGGTDNIIAYCWHSVEGYSKFGSYTGNGSADGPFVYCGFRVGWLMYKRSDTTGNWAILDNKRNLYNVVNNRLFADESWAESDLFGVADFTSNGFKIRTDAGSTNATNGTYIFMAFAEQPFKFSNAR
jgi:hypothetical protein